MYLNWESKIEVKKGKIRRSVFLEVYFRNNGAGSTLHVILTLQLKQSKEFYWSARGIGETYKTYILHNKDSVHEFVAQLGDGFN